MRAAPPPVSACRGTTQRQDFAERPASFTDQQWLGKQLFFDRNLLELFNGKAMCAMCHTSAADTSSGNVLFTDFSYANAGVPKSPKNTFYTLDARYNPAGKSFVDLGLGGQLKKRGENGAPRRAIKTLLRP